MKKYSILILFMLSVSTLFAQNSNDSIESKGQVGFEAGYMFGVSDNSTNGMKLHFAGGRQINPVFLIGLGAGVHFFPGFRTFAFPVFSDFQLKIPRRKVEPYFSCNIGYSFNPGMEAYNINDQVGKAGFLRGLMFSPAIGVGIKHAGSCYTIELGYEGQAMRFYEHPGFINHKRPFHTELIGAISICLGLKGF